MRTYFFHMVLKLIENQAIGLGMKRSAGVRGHPVCALLYHLI